MRIFATRVWGFDPKNYPMVSFSSPGARNRLIAESTDGDIILFCTTKTDVVAPDEKGKILGYVEFLRDEANASDLFADDVELADHLFEDGKFKFPFAVPIVRAWELDPPVDIKTTLGRQLTAATRSSFEELADEDEKRAIKNLPKKEIPLPENNIAKRHSRNNRKPLLDTSEKGQPGPPPAEWSEIISQQDGPTATYLFQFGDRDVWKIGISKNPQSRLNQLNFSIPYEVLGEQWVHRLQEIHSTGREAYEMEQALLTVLEEHKTKHERVVCSERLVKNRWYDYKMGRI